MKNFSAGFQYLFTGFRLIRQSGLRRYVLMPMLINIVVFALLTWLGIYQFDAMMEWLLPKGDAWWVGAARVILWTVFAFIVLLVLYFLFTLVANIIASPFNALLSEKVMSKLGLVLPESHGWMSAFTGFPASMASEGRKLIYFLAIFLVLGLLTIIPLVNLVTPFLWPLATGWMLSLEYVAYPSEAAGNLFSDTRKKARDHRMMALGFGMAVMLCTLIPLLNLLVIPAAVAGATAMWVEHWSRPAV